MPLLLIPQGWIRALSSPKKRDCIGAVLEGHSYDKLMERTKGEPPVTKNYAGCGFLTPCALCN